MITNIIMFGVPVLLSPLFVWIIGKLTPIFIGIGAQLFLAKEVPDVVMRSVGKGIGVRCVVIYILCWSAAYGSHLLKWPYMIAIGFCIAGVFLSIFSTISLVKHRVGMLSWTDSMMVGLIAYTGGNLPLFIIIPLILMFLSI